MRLGIMSSRGGPTVGAVATYRNTLPYNHLSLIHRPRAARPPPRGTRLAPNASTDRGTHGRDQPRG